MGVYTDGVLSIHPPIASAKHTLHHTCPAFSGEFEYLFVGTTTWDVAVVLIKNLVVQHFLLCLQGMPDEHGLDFPSDISLPWSHCAFRQFCKEYCVGRRRHDLTSVCDCYFQNAWLTQFGRKFVSSPLISSVLRLYGVCDGTQCSADVSGCCRTWDQKLSSGLLPTFTFTLLFQFRIADTEQTYYFRRFFSLLHQASIGSRCLPRLLTA